MSSTTSPSSLRLRPSAVYSGRGFSRILTIVVGESPAAAFFLGVLSPTAAPAKPPLCTTPCFPPPLGGGFATPFPNPVLATVPRTPLAPPVPFPYPSPPGNAGEPRRLMFVVLLGFPLPGRPFGSPNPPVCTLFTGAVTVAGAALPVPKLLTFTSSRERFGPLVGVFSFASNTLCVVISGAFTSNCFTFG